MKKEKIIVAAVILLLVFVVGGAAAFFTDTESVTNTFTIGDVDITLTEPDWDDTDHNNNGVPDAAEGRTPGQVIAKDPTITNVGTNDAYVFAKVVAACTGEVSPAVPKEIFTYTTNTGWYLMTDSNTCSNGTITKIYAYGSNAAMTRLAKNGTATLFDEVTINTAITGDEVGLSGNKNIVVTGYAIQADGINATSPSAVWTASNFS